MACVVDLDMVPEAINEKLEPMVMVVPEQPIGESCCDKQSHEGMPLGMTVVTPSCPQFSLQLEISRKRTTLLFHLGVQGRLSLGNVAHKTPFASP